MFLQMLHSKCYAIIKTNYAFEGANQVPFREKWHVFCNFGRQLRIMVRHGHGAVSYSPLYIHSFSLLQPHKLTDAETFNITHSDPGQLATIADKLRYYRYKKALLQREVADHAGVNRSTYIHFENGMDAYPLDKLERIALLLEVAPPDLMDAYHLFLWRGQGEQIKALRLGRSWTQKQLAEMLGVRTGTVKRWEAQTITISRRMWERLTELLAQ